MFSGDTYAGCFASNAVIYHVFTLTDNTGLPVAWGSSRAPSTYVMTNNTAAVSPGSGPGGNLHGVTMASAFNGITGLNNLKVDTSVDTNLFKSGNTYFIVVATGFSGTVKAAGQVLMEFGIVTETDNINQAQTLTIPATTQSTVGQSLVNMHYATDYMAFTLPANPTQSTVGHSLVTARQATEFMKFTLPASPTQSTVGHALMAARQATEYIDAAITSRLALATALSGAPTAQTVGEALKFAREATAYVDAAISGRLALSTTLSGAPTPQTVGEALKFAREATAYANSTAIGAGGVTAASFAAGAIDATAIAANAIGTSEVDVAVASLFADALLTRRLDAGTGGSGNRLVRDALYGLRNKVSIVSGVLTVTGVDDTTTAWTANVASQSVSEVIVQVTPI